MPEPRRVKVGTLADSLWAPGRSEDRAAAFRAERVAKAAGTGFYRPTPSSNDDDDNEPELILVFDPHIEAQLNKYLTPPQSPVQRPVPAIIAQTTQPRQAQNISEADFFAAYEARSKAKNPTPSPSSASKSSPTSSLKQAKSQAQSSTSSNSSPLKLNPTAAPFRVTSNLEQAKFQANSSTSSTSSLLKLNPTAAPIQQRSSSAMAATVQPRQAQNISEADFFAAYEARNKAKQPTASASSASKLSPTSGLQQAKSLAQSSTSSNSSPSKLNPIAAPFQVTSNPEQAKRQAKSSPSSTSSLSKLSPTATPFTMNVTASRNILVTGATGPWPQFGVECIDENWVTVSGLDQPELEFDDRVSEAGLEDLPRQIVRATEGNDMTNQLLDWDGKRWAPPPACWENDRAGFDGAFVPNYVREWVQTTPSGEEVTLSTSTDAFIDGKAPVDNDVLISPVSQPDIVQNPNPDSDLVTKAPTSEAAVLLALNKQKAANNKNKLNKATIKHQNEQLAAFVPGPSPFQPAMEMYLRPAEPKDAAGIAAIYNMAIQSSNIPEDQAPITAEQVAWFITEFKDKLPFIVAVRGACPKVHSTDSLEQVIGYARCEPFDFGMVGATDGRSRGTGLLHVYVDPQFRRKRVGYNLMDRLLHILSPGHAYMEGAKWVNPTGSKYAETAGCGRWHQLFFKFAVFKDRDDTYEWMKSFLYGKFYFKETARLPSAARSKLASRDAQFMDLVFLQREAMPAGEFEPYM
ncbi:uncharacterized protein LY89DRAFT_770041 [Mollisia scopiformis]|uniref:N-acetyltransferase domain-containing protein n=1 Tax=Mollisia scopiformis TaxID=149040 RepID=A0A194XL34_MOLSC|nr:uncharacterized protein LY89DRAFT_770041 [Mollisia scopiformis]KUJ20888.1 hypothetical protein LY89DRAFT_770041 [Mollisia scopiformis]